MSNAPKLQLVNPTSTPDRESFIDEFGELKRQEALFDPKAKRLKLLRELLLSWLPASHPDDQPFEFHGRHYIAQITPAQNERTVPLTKIAKLLKFMGAAKFWACVDIGIGKLEASLGKEKAATWLVKGRSGPRNVSAVAKEAPESPKAA